MTILRVQRHWKKIAQSIQIRKQSHVTVKLGCMLMMGRPIKWLNTAQRELVIGTVAVRSSTFS